jgi:transcriptional regulator with XRE-family HTH domain
MSETIAQRLKRLLEEARAGGMKISAKSLSLALGGGETYVGDIIRGRVKNPSMAKLSRIAKQLRVPVERLLPEDGYEAPESAYLELREAPSEGDFPLLTPEFLATILTALPQATSRIKRQPAADRLSEAIYRAHGWMLDEAAAGRPVSADAVVNFLSHIL